MDLEIRELTSELVQVLNKYNNVPVEIKRYVIKDIYTQIEKVANEIIAQEIQARNEQNKKDAEESANTEGATKK